MVCVVKIRLDIPSAWDFCRCGPSCFAMVRRWMRSLVAAGVMISPRWAPSKFRDARKPG
jgi:hypothetical protein